MSPPKGPLEIVRDKAYRNKLNGLCQHSLCPGFLVGKCSHPVKWTAPYFSPNVGLYSLINRTFIISITSVLISFAPIPETSTSIDSGLILLFLSENDSRNVPTGATNLSLCTLTYSHNFAGRNVNTLNVLKDNAIGGGLRNWHRCCYMFWEDKKRLIFLVR